VRNYDTLLATDPETLVTEAVIRMLPRGRLGRRVRRNLRVFAGATHDHQAQQPVAIDAPGKPRLSAAAKAASK
jgi:large subunit ribosomal protein L13